MLTQIQRIGVKLWVQIAVLALVMPVAGAFTGWYYAVLVAESGAPILSALIGFVIGIIVDIVCYYENLFSLVFYRLPIPIVLYIVFFEAASFFVSQWLAIIIGIAGLALGLLVVRTLIIPNPFYTVRKRVLILVYVFLSFFMLGVMMGVPVSNFLLGILAGNYFSLRYAGSVMSRARLKRNLIAVTILAAVVLLVSELIFAWLIWQDSANILDYLNEVLGLTLTKQNLLAAIIAFGVIAVLVQLFITYTSASVMYHFRLRKMLIDK